MVAWHLTMNCFPPNAMSGQHCENYDVKRETVHCYPRNVDRCCTWWLESQRGFQFCFCFVLLYNKSLNDWSLGEQWILFPSNLDVSLDFVSGNIEILGKQNSLFPSGPVIKCWVSFQFLLNQLSAVDIITDTAFLVKELKRYTQTIQKKY